MPFTPFHFGPAVLLKALAPRYVSLTAFVASQVAIDLESGYHLLQGNWPVHRLAHTLLVSTLIGVAMGTGVWFAGRQLRVVPGVELEPELGPLPAHAGGLLGGLSHSVLDAIMHADVQPFWPFTRSNSLLGALDLAQLHLFCMAAGAAGALVLICKRARRRGIG
jgi:membrane-bound metal-dependent hydrolase YbcI (DUF457 family)